MESKALEFIKNHRFYKSIPITEENSIFYHVAPTNYAVLMEEYKNSCLEDAIKSIEELNSVDIFTSYQNKLKVLEILKAKING